MDNLVIEWKKFLNEIIASPDKAKEFYKTPDEKIYQSKNNHLFIVDKTIENVFKTQHKNLGKGSAFNPNINMDAIVDAISELSLKTAKVQYKIVVPDAGYDFIMKKNNKSSFLRDVNKAGYAFYTDTVEKRGKDKAMTQVERITIDADLNDKLFQRFRTSTVSIVLPAKRKHFGAAPGISPETVRSGLDRLNKVLFSDISDEKKKKFVIQFYRKGKLHTLLSAYPAAADFQYPTTSEWKNYCIINPSLGAKSDIEDKADTRTTDIDEPDSEEIDSEDDLSGGLEEFKRVISDLLLMEKRSRE